MKKQYNIMTSCDDHLAPYVAAGLVSMADNLRDTHVDFYLLHSQVSKKNIEMLESLCRELKGGTEIQFHEVFVADTEIYDELARYGGGWSKEAYYPLGAHLLLPDSVDRVLYLDAGDTLVVGDIEPYYSYDFQDKSLVVTGSRFKLQEDELELFDRKDLNDEKAVLGILRGIFNSGSYIINLDKMRKKKRSLEAYRHLNKVLREIFGENNNIYWGDQGFLSIAFVGDVRYFGYPEIRNIWYMPYNFCLWYFDQIEEQPGYDTAVIHFAGTAFKPWDGTYSGFIERFQKKECLRSMDELKYGQLEYYELWYRYASMADEVLKKAGR